MIKLVIFDLDGTLLDTIADLANSTNYALQHCGFPVHSMEAYRFFVGNGIGRLFERALPQGEQTEENILRIRQAFLAYYGEHHTDCTAPYPGIPELLEQLQEEGFLLAVASNKYQEATSGLIAHYFPGISFVRVLGQREGVNPKPDPAIVYDILSAASATSRETLYVGDSGIDMQTAVNSGVISCGVTWGFRPRAELESFSPDYIADRTEEIRDFLHSYAR
jgi:phosphoglycolate phosphatase